MQRIVPFRWAARTAGAVKWVAGRRTALARRPPLIAAAPPPPAAPAALLPHRSSALAPAAQRRPQRLRALLRLEAAHRVDAARGGGPQARGKAR
eukprot:3551117-Prymnesium_polylepis.2